MSIAAKSIPRSRERNAMRVIKGGLTPADPGSAERLRERLRVGDLVFVEIKKPRNPQFNKLAHVLGNILVQNIEEFEAMSGHKVLKRLQVEGNIGCDEMAVMFPGIGPCTYRIPRSLSFESMDESEFSEVFKGFCRHVHKQYWSSLSPEAIEDMARMQANDA